MGKIVEPLLKRRGASRHIGERRSVALETRIDRAGHRVRKVVMLAGRMVDLACSPDKTQQLAFHRRAVE